MAFNSFPQKGGIPSGQTAARPSSPAIGDTYYNGELGILEIYTSGDWQPCSAPPATPGSIVATNVGGAYSTNSSISVAFTPGSGGGLPTNYIAYTTTGGFTASGTASPLVLTSLTNGDSYTTYVVAQNGFGNSVASGNSATILASRNPQTPTIGTASTSSVTTSVTVTWTLGANGGAPLSAITVTPYLNGTTAGTTQNAATTTATSMSFTGLTVGSSYTFKVKTTNANGTSPESSATNSITIPLIIPVDFLVIAGGGGGGGGNSGSGGAGGAGGYRTSAGTSGAGSAAESQLSLVGSTNYSVVVGAGGAGLASQSHANGNKGSDSTFSTITSAGGGAGVGGDGTGKDGGSGGGGAASGGSGATGGTGTALQGRAGGNGQNSNPNYVGGGGGGASTAGSNGTPGSFGGAGGDGLASDITGTSVTRAGGGGGGAGRESAGNNFDGGTGKNGGGNGGPSYGSSAAGQNATANTGSGGGGAGYNPSATPTGAGASGSGGAGVVILRYPDTRTITIGAGLTGTESAASGGFKRATITAGSGNVSWA